MTFLVRGGHDVGMGHVYRSMALAESMTAAGHDLSPFLCNDDPHSLATLQDHGHEVVSYSVSETIADGLENPDVLSAPDAVIVDVPEPIPGVLRSLKRTKPKTPIVALDYPDLSEPHLDALVSLFNHDPSLKRPSAPHVKYYEGPQYAIIRESFRPFLGRHRPVPDHPKTLLVTFGGSDLNGHTVKVLNALRGFRDSTVKCHVVIGPTFSTAEEIRMVAESIALPSELHYSVRHMERLMFECDLGIHGSGTTFLEMASLGRPSVVIPQNDNEHRFANWFAERGALVNLGCADRLQPDAIRKAIEEMMADKTRRESMSKTLRRLVDGRGRERIIAVVESCLAPTG